MVFPLGKLLQLLKVSEQRFVELVILAVSDFRCKNRRLNLHFPGHDIHLHKEGIAPG